MRGLCCALLWIVAGWLHAEEEEFIAPPPPADGILDDARIFARNPERHRAVAGVLAALEEKHDFRCYYVLYSSLYGRNLADRAHALRQAWLGEAPGIVLVLETDSRSFRVGQAAQKPTEINPGTRLPLSGPKELAPADLGAIVRDMEEGLRGSTGGEEFAERLATGMAAGISALLDERAAVPESTTRPRLVLLAIGFGAAAGLIALLVVAGLKRAEAKSLERFVFPKADVGIRLGAPHGGGKVSSRSFGNSRAGQ